MADCRSITHASQILTHLSPIELNFIAKAEEARGKASMAAAEARAAEARVAAIEAEQRTVTVFSG